MFIIVVEYQFITIGLYYAFFIFVYLTVKKIFMLMFMY